MLIQNKQVNITDWNETYSSLVSATKNKKNTVNRWYPILEGYSTDFVEAIINEQEEMPSVCLDPFAGGGTTPLVAQTKGMKCYSFEVSPFMSQVCRAKLRNDYDINELTVIIDLISSLLEGGLKHGFKMGSKTSSKRPGHKKWLFHKTALDSLLCIRKAIDIACLGKEKYLDLLYVALASQIVTYSNVYRDGKALRYRNGWENKFPKRKDIYSSFFNICNQSVLNDVERIAENNRTNEQNIKYFYSGDCRQLLDHVDDSLVDLVITSPPYLNSRDYTDSHMLELWLLGHVTDYTMLKELRGKTMRSHVQVSWGEIAVPQSNILKTALAEINIYEEKFWNKNIPSMIAGYFCDIQIILEKLFVKMKRNGRIYMNVANSSYFGVVIKTDRIIEEIAKNLGYTVEEIRLARKIKTSSQQFEEVKWLRESVIVMKK